MADLDYSSVDDAVKHAEYDSACEILEKNKKYYYSKNDSVLYYLDQGLLRHFAADYESSNSYLSSAEKEIEQNFTKSVIQKIGQAVINDTVAEYSGETYEDIYTNIFMCLNYIHRNEFEDAMVEIRRFDNKMKVVGMEYQDLINAQKQTLEQEYKYSGADSVDSSVEFHNSAFARYLSMLLYRSQNDLNSAEIDYKKIREAFSTQPSIYDFSIPECIDGELCVPDDMARVNVICFTGRSPVKTEEVLRIPFDGAYYKLALPVLSPVPSRIYSVQAVMKNRETQKVYTADLSALEKIDNIVEDTYKQHYAAMYTRALARSIGKSVTSGVFGAVSENNSDSMIGAIFAVLNLFSQVTTEATERADVRICRYFPSLVSVCGVTVPDGVYDIAVNYYGRNNSLLHTHSVSNFEVKAGKLNLVESNCLC